MIFRDYLRMTTCIALPGRTLLLLAIVLAGALCFAAPALATTTGTTGDFAWSDTGSRVTITLDPAPPRSPTLTGVSRTYRWRNSLGEVLVALAIAAAVLIAVLVFRVRRRPA